MANRTTSPYVRRFMEAQAHLGHGASQRVEPTIGDTIRADYVGHTQYPMLIATLTDDGRWQYHDQSGRQVCMVAMRTRDCRFGHDWQGGIAFMPAYHKR